MKIAAADDNALDRECEVFCRYLIGQGPNEYVKRKYREAHRVGALLGRCAHPADAILVKIARIGPWSAKIIDTYTRVFRPSSAARKKLVLLLAILESCAPTHAYLDAVDTHSLPLLFLRLAQRCLTFVLVMFVGILIIFPAELMVWVDTKRVSLWLPRNE